MNIDKQRNLLHVLTSEIDTLPKVGRSVLAGPHLGGRLEAIQRGRGGPFSVSRDPTAVMATEAEAYPRTIVSLL